MRLRVFSISCRREEVEWNANSQEKQSDVMREDVLRMGFPLL